MIRHTVAFRLKHPRGSAEEKSFLAAGKALADIPGVERFEQLGQVSPKNDFHFGYSMEFVDQKAYQGYNDHPRSRRLCARPLDPRSRGLS